MVEAVRALAALLPLATAAAQPPVAPHRTAFDALNAGRHLEAVDGFAALALDGRGGPRDQAAHQTWMQVAPFVAGELDPAARAHLGGPPPPDPALVLRAAARHRATPARPGAKRCSAGA